MKGHPQARSTISAQRWRSTWLCVIHWRCPCLAKTAGLLPGRAQPGGSHARGFLPTCAEPPRAGAYPRFKAALIGIPAAYLAGIPALVTVHNYPADAWARLFLPRMKAFSRTPLVRYIAVSNALAEELARWGISREKITVIYNGVDPARFAGAAGHRKFSGVEQGRMVVGTVPGWFHKKGSTCFAGCRQAGRPLSGHASGCGDGLERNLFPLAPAGPAKQDGFTGHCHDIATELALMDIFVLPSLSEGMGISLLAFAAAAWWRRRGSVVPDVVEDGSPLTAPPPMSPWRRGNGAGGEPGICRPPRSRRARKG